METASQRRRQKEWWPACLFGAPYTQGHLGFCSGGRVRSRLHGAVEPLPLEVFLRVRRRRWCWWLAGVVGCGATSVVLVASRDRRWCWWLAGAQLWYPASVVLVAGRHPLGCLLRSGRWSLNLLWSRVAPLILVSQRQVVMERWSVEGQDTGSGVSKMETTAGARQQSGFICSAAIFSTPKIRSFVRSVFAYCPQMLKAY